MREQFSESARQNSTGFSSHRAPITFPFVAIPAEVFGRHTTPATDREMRLDCCVFVRESVGLSSGQFQDTEQNMAEYWCTNRARVRRFIAAMVAAGFLRLIRAGCAPRPAIYAVVCMEAPPEAAGPIQSAVKSAPVVTSTTMSIGKPAKEKESTKEKEIQRTHENQGTPLPKDFSNPKNYPLDRSGGKRAVTPDLLDRVGAGIGMQIRKSGLGRSIADQLRLVGLNRRELVFVSHGWLSEESLPQVQKFLWSAAEKAGHRRGRDIRVVVQERPIGNRDQFERLVM